MLHFLKSEAVPVQPVPPCTGTGLEHVLALVCVPPSHANVHVVQSCHSAHCPSTTEYKKLYHQVDGEGFEHFLVLACVPHPNVSVHTDYWYQTPHRPFTAKHDLEQVLI